MISIEVEPRVAIPDFNDPYYAQRDALRSYAPSLPINILGMLTDHGSFSQIYVPPEASDEDAGKIDVDVRPKVQGNGHVVYEFSDRLAQFVEAIRLIAAHEHAAYPQARHATVSIAADQKTVGAGNYQRNHTFHRDGMKHAWLHIYVVSDYAPTEFAIFNQVAGDVIYSEEELPDDTNIVVPEPYQVVAANKTTYHRSPRLTEAALRTFLRVTYEHKIGR